MEHEAARRREAPLEDPALALAEHHGVGQLRRLQRRPGRDVVEEVAVEVERVDQVVLEHVDEVDPHELVALHGDRLVHVGEADRVDGVDLVGAVEVRVEPVHDHHHLVRLLPALLGVDQEGAVEPLGDVLGERAHVAVVEVQPVRHRVELVDRAPAGRDLARPEPRHAVHLGRVDAVEVDRVRVAGGVDEGDAQPLALAGAQRGAGDAAVVGPGREADAGRDLDLLVLRHERPLAHHAAAREGPRDAPVEVAQQLVRVEAVGGVVDRAAVERRVAAVRLGAVPRVRVGCLRLGLPRVAVRDGGVQAGPGETERRHARGQQSASCQAGHDLNCGTPKSEVQPG